MNIDRANLSINGVKANLLQIIIAEDFNSLQQKKNAITAKIRGWVDKWVNETITTEELCDYCDHIYLETKRLVEDLEQIQQQMEQFLSDRCTSNEEPLIILNELLGK